MVKVKTDNGRLDSKLLLRRYFLEKYHPGGTASVIDCCQGSGILWSAIRKEHAVKSYIGFDVKPKPGRLAIDSVRILAGKWNDWNIVDIDTYGSPWRHYAQVLKNSTGPITVFLTMGAAGVASPAEIKAALGVPEKTPPGIVRKLWSHALSRLLTTGCDCGTIPTEVVEATASAHARYFGVRLDWPGKHDEPRVVTSARRNTTRAEKEHEHV